jgi:hypothetical protein
MNTNSTFECYLLKASPNINEQYVIEDNTIYIKCEETFDNIFYKTQEALKIFNLSEYNYIFRTNLSSFIVFDKYKRWLETLPKENVYNGNILWYGEYPYITGCGFTITPDVAEIIMNYKEPHYIIDDITFGKICKENSIITTTAPVCHIFEESFERELKVFNSFDKAYHLRVSSPNKSKDIQIYYHLLNIYYSIYVIE